MKDETSLIGRSDAELAAVDPLEMNLLVAKGVASLAGLDILHYKWQADAWANKIKRKLPGYEREFWRTPQDWDNDIHMFRLGVVCQVVHNDLGIRYKEDQKSVGKVSYTDPGDLFLNGVMDTRRGTCGNMTALHVALGWRLRWPVSIAMARWHCILRFDNGQVVWNVEASNTEGGFRTNPDGYYQREYNIPQEHIDCGSDLAFLTPRQLLGHFVGTRGRHFYDMLDPSVPKTDEEYAYYSVRAKQDFQAAVALYPQSRLYARMIQQCGYLPPHNRQYVTVAR